MNSETKQKNNEQKNKDRSYGWVNVASFLLIILVFLAIFFINDRRIDRYFVTHNAVFLMGLLIGVIVPMGFSFLQVIDARKDISFREKEIASSSIFLGASGIYLTALLVGYFFLRSEIPGRDLQGAILFSYGFASSGLILLILLWRKPQRAKDSLLPITLIIWFLSVIFKQAEAISFGLIFLIFIATFRIEISQTIKRISTAISLKLEGPKASLAFDFPKIKSFSDLVNNIYDLLQNSDSDEVIRFMAYTPALGFLALPDDRWVELRNLILSRKDSIRMVCLEEQDLRLWHNRFEGRITKRGVISRDITKSASLVSERLIEELERDKTNRVKRKVLGRLPGYYIFSSTERAIIAAPIFLPLPPGTRQDFLGQTPQMLGFDTDNPLLVMVINSIYDLYYHKVDEKPLIYIRNENIFTRENPDKPVTDNLFVKKTITTEREERKKDEIRYLEKLEFQIEDQIDEKVVIYHKNEKIKDPNFKQAYEKINSILDERSRPQLSDLKTVFHATLRELIKLSKAEENDSDLEKSYCYRLEIFEAIEKD